MLRLIISGCNGHMGRVVESICRGEADVEIAAGFDLLGQGERDYPVYSSPAEFTGEASVIIDFSHPLHCPLCLNLASPKNTSGAGYHRLTPPQICLPLTRRQSQFPSFDPPICRWASMSLSI